MINTKSQPLGQFQGFNLPMHLTSSCVLNNAVQCSLLFFCLPGPTWSAPSQAIFHFLQGILNRFIQTSLAKDGTCTVWESFITPLVSNRSHTLLHCYRWNFTYSNYVFIDCFVFPAQLTVYSLLIFIVLRLPQLPLSIH